MTKKALLRLVVIKKIEDNRIGQVAAAREIGVSDRQMRRIWKAYKALGKQGIMSKRRVRPSHRRIDPKTMNRAMKQIEKHYSEFGPTLAAEKLQKRAIHQRRKRWECEGALVQIEWISP